MGDEPHPDTSAMQIEGNALEEALHFWAEHLLEEITSALEGCNDVEVLEQILKLLND